MKTLKEIMDQPLRFEQIEKFIELYNRIQRAKPGTNVIILLNDLELMPHESNEFIKIFGNNVEEIRNFWNIRDYHETIKRHFDISY